MLAALDRYLSARSHFELGIYSLVLLGAVGTVDFATGADLSFSIFYAIPVGLSAWYLGRRFGLLFSVLSALVLYWVDAAGGHQAFGTTSSFWNAGVFLGFFLIITALLDKLHRALEALASQAQRDGLTGLLNDRTFRERCAPAFALAARHRRTLALGYIDLDGFKGINDQSGHALGDQVLREVAAAITKLLRGTDFAGRLGGDEFGVLLVETTPDGPQIFFGRLHDALNALAAKHSWPLGISIGVGVFHPPPVTPDDAIRFADQLMYQVKHSGKNRVLVQEVVVVAAPPGPK